MFKKKDKIEFFSKIAGVAEAFPIIPAKDFRPKWMSRCKQHYVDNKDRNLPSHLYQCPGIFDLYNYGFILPLWHDVIIKTEAGHQGFQYINPSETLSKLLEGDPVASQPPDISKWLPKRPHSIEAIVKFNTPWHVVAPKGVKFLITPVAYSDSYEFESSIGVLDPSINTELNIQGYWNIPNGERKLTAGTPIAHIIPLTEEKYDHIIRDMTEEDWKFFRKKLFWGTHSFKHNKALIKSMYKKHFGR